jgi:hypothetical protein
MNDFDSDRDNVAHKIATLEAGAGVADLARKSEPQRGGGGSRAEEGSCVMFRAWSSDAWVFATGRRFFFF